MGGDAGKGRFFSWRCMMANGVSSLFSTFYLPTSSYSPGEIFDSVLYCWREAGLGGGSGLGGEGAGGWAFASNDEMGL